ncbi:MAG: hypothetical protein FWD51_00965 [Betaproteobacteria bacterium]|nr:hypothetical protein [Betaproteobacteria bacterium]
MDHQDSNQPDTPPHETPTANMVSSSSKEGTFIPGGRSVSPGDSLAWISSAWYIFKKKPGEWILFALIYVGTAFLLPKVLPSVIQLIVPFILVLLIAGLIHTCSQFQRKGAFSLGNFFAAFMHQTRPLLVLGLFSLGFSLALVAIMGTFLGSVIIEGASTPTRVVAGGGMASVGILIMFAAAIAYAMAVWFAPALVMMHNIAPLAAIKMSFFACRKNILPGIFFFIVMGVLLFLSAIPLGLGLLITWPMFFLCYYTSYRSVFLDANS